MGGSRTAPVMPRIIGAAHSVQLLQQRLAAGGGHVGQQIQAQHAQAADLGGGRPQTERGIEFSLQALQAGHAGSINVCRGVVAAEYWR